MPYLNEVLKVCGVATVCLALLLISSRAASGVAFAVRVAGIVVIFGVLLSIVGESVSELLDILSAHTVSSGSDYPSKAFSLMLKALGITLLCKICADICRDCGENTLAGGVEGVGRAVILSLCIPVISEILGYSAEVMEMSG